MHKYSIGNMGDNKYIMMPKVSIIVPVYKVEKYIDRCIKSILNQRFKDFELLLIDDGSPDSCGVLCDYYASNDTRIKVVHQCNKGLSGARNTGLDISKGQFICFVDSDDEIKENYIQAMLNVIDKYNVDIVECKRVDVYPNRIEIASDNTYEVEIFDKNKALEGNVNNTLFYQTVWNKMYRKEVIGSIRFPEGKLHEDEYFTWKVISRCNVLATVDASLYMYNHREGSIMETFSFRRLDFFEARIERHYYIENNTKDLVLASKMSIVMPCILVMQKLLHLNNKEQIRVCSPLLNKYYDLVRLSKKELASIGWRNKIWLIIANVSLITCAKIRYFLKRNM